MLALVFDHVPNALYSFYFCLYKHAYTLRRSIIRTIMIHLEEFEKNLRSLQIHIYALNWRLIQLFLETEYLA